MSAIVWLRRDLRRADLPTIAAAHERAAGGGVTVCFVLNPAFFDTAGAARRAWLAATLLALRETWFGHLTLLHGEPAQVLPAFVSARGAASVHVSTVTEPAGAARDACVREALAERGVAWVETGSPSAVTPGRVRTREGKPFEVFTPFAKVWREHGWRAPAAEPEGLVLAPAAPADETWARLEAALDAPGVPDLPPAGQEAAVARWRAFLEDGLAGYATHRDRPDLDGTSQLSPCLKFGVLHPRTLLADLQAYGGPGRRALHHRAGLAGVLRPRAAPPPGASRPTCVSRSPVCGTRRSRTWWRRGNRAAPASRSWTPVCANCWRPAGCTIGCAW